MQSLDPIDRNFHDLLLTLKFYDDMGSIEWQDRYPSCLDRFPAIGSRLHCAYPQVSRLVLRSLR